MTTSTDTPRTDAIISAVDMDAAFQDLCRQLERELAAEIANREKCCRDGNTISDELFDTQLKLKASEAEAEAQYTKTAKARQLLMKSRIEADDAKLKVQALDSELKNSNAELIKTQQELAEADKRITELQALLNGQRKDYMATKAEIERFRFMLNKSVALNDRMSWRFSKWDKEIEKLNELKTEIDLLDISMDDWYHGFAKITKV